MITNNLVYKSYPNIDKYCRFVNERYALVSKILFILNNNATFNDMTKSIEIFNEYKFQGNEKYDKFYAYLYIIDIYEKKIVNCDSQFFYLY